MNFQIQHFVSILSCLGFSFAQGQFVQSYSGEDHFIGGPLNDYKNTDVIDYYGPNFDLIGWSVDHDIFARNLTVRIQSSYFNFLMNGGSKSTPSELGDLFLSTSGLNWSFPDDTSNINVSNGSDWDLVARLGTYYNVQQRWNRRERMYVITEGPLIEESNVGQIFEVDPDGVILSSAMTGATYRIDQEVRYDPVSGQDSLGSFIWHIDEDTEELVVSLSYLGVLDGTETLGFRWGMSTGTDVIEFEVPLDMARVSAQVTPVPEPATLSLLAGCGLASILWLRRKRLGIRKA